MDNSVTEDKVINEATMFEWLELTVKLLSLSE